MKKYQYIAAIACVLVGALGFAGLYAYNKSKDQIPEDSQLVENSQEISSEDTQKENDQLADNEDVSESTETEVEDELVSNTPDDTEEQDEDTPVGNVKDEVLHFQPERGLVWPVEGPVLLDYNMDGTIYYPTLEQYQYSSAMVIGGKVNSKVYFVAKGKITNIETNEVTGCTVTQDLGDGYTAIYGQLKELNFGVGDMVESGQVVGYISEPTKYFAVEGPNVYFQLLKDGVPMDPEELLSE